MRHCGRVEHDGGREAGKVRGQLSVEEGEARKLGELDDDISRIFNMLLYLCEVPPRVYGP